MLYMRVTMFDITISNGRWKVLCSALLVPQNVI